MFSVTKTFEICYAHRLRDYPGPCKELHGHNGIIQVTYEAEGLGKEGMVSDFPRIADWFRPVKASLDHTTILDRSDPLVGDLHGKTKLFLLHQPPTAEALAEYIGVNLINRPSKVEFWETRDNKGEWNAS